MKFTKTMAKSLIFAMALGALPVIGFGKMTTFAAEPTPTFDGAAGKVTLDNGYWGVAKELKKAPKEEQKDFYLNKGTKWYQVKNIQKIEGREVDLSKYKGKKVLLAFGENAYVKNKDSWVVKEITPVKAFKAFYSTGNKKAGNVTLAEANTVGGADYGYLSFFSKSGADRNLTQIALDKVKTNIEVKKGSGDWKIITEFFNANLDNVNTKLHSLTQRGASLSFRMKAENNPAWVWGSKESKVKIPSQAKAPKVKVDVDKNTISLKKDVSSYALQKEGADVGDFTKATDKMKLYDAGGVGIKFEGTSDDDTKTQYLYVKELPKNKIETKVLKLTFKKQTKPTEATTLASKGIENQGGDILNVPEKVKFELVNKYQLEKGAFVKNFDEEHEYEVGIDSAGSANKPDKWFKLKKAKSGKASVLKFAHSKTAKANAFTPSTSKLYLRLAGINGKKPKENEFTMPSPSINGLIKVAALPQAMTITSTTSNPDGFTMSGNADTLAFDLKAAVNTEKTYTIKAKITNIEKKKASPNVKISTPFGGVKVTATPFEEAGEDVTFDIVVSIPTTAFSSAPTGSQTLKFKVTAESVKDREYTITFKP